jgi:hypothetical protein
MEEQSRRSKKLKKSRTCWSSTSNAQPQFRLRQNACSRRDLEESIGPRLSAAL